MTSVGFFSLPDAALGIETSSWVPTDCTDPKHYVCEIPAGETVHLIPPSSKLALRAYLRLKVQRRRGPIRRKRAHLTLPPRGAQPRVCKSTIKGVLGLQN